MDVAQQEGEAAPGPSSEGSAGTAAAAAAPALSAFAVVDEVSEGSPAATAGIMVSERGRKPQRTPSHLGHWPFNAGRCFSSGFWLLVTVIQLLRYQGPSTSHVHASMAVQVGDRMCSFGGVGAEAGPRQGGELQRVAQVRRKGERDPG